MSKYLNGDTEVESKDLPAGWQVSVGNLGGSVQLRKAKLSFVKDDAPEIEAPAPEPAAEPPPAPPISEPAPGNPGFPLLRAAGFANGGLGLVALGVALFGVASSALVVAGALSMLINAGFFLVLGRNKSSLL
ncbi:MAG TPA: hypothetical protein VI643_01440 [Planctomycetota bacterium]|nr:hypothetical protein [Planctomycetota bacterium]